MNYCIREMKKYEYPLLNDFLYEAIFIPEGRRTAAEIHYCGPRITDLH